MTKKVDEAAARLGADIAASPLTNDTHGNDIRLLLDDRKACWELLERAMGVVEAANNDRARRQCPLTRRIKALLADFERLKGDE